MPSQTTALAIPYPVGTDLLADGDNAIQALAERLDALLMASATTIPWINVGSGGTAPAFGAGFTNYGGGFTPVRFRKLGGLVYIQGLITTSSTVAANTPMFTLPVGYRPSADLLHGTFYSPGALRVDVQAGGVVMAPGAGLSAGTFVGLNLPPFAAA